MEFKGAITSKGEIKSGEGKNGTWRSQTIVLTQIEQSDYPDQLVLDMMNTKIDECPEVGSVVTVKYNVRAREYNGRWFGQNSLWKMEIDTASTPEPQTTANIEAPKDDLPF